MKNKTAKTLKTNRTKQEKCSEKTKDIFERFFAKRTRQHSGKDKVEFKDMDCDAFGEKMCLLSCPQRSIMIVGQKERRK